MYCILETTKGYMYFPTEDATICYSQLIII